MRLWEQKKYRLFKSDDFNCQLASERHWHLELRGLYGKVYNHSLDGQTLQAWVTSPSRMRILQNEPWAKIHQNCIPYEATFTFNIEYLDKVGVLLRLRRRSFLSPEQKKVNIERLKKHQFSRMKSAQNRVKNERSEVEPIESTLEQF